MSMTSMTTVVASVLALVLFGGVPGPERVEAQSKAGSKVVKALTLRDHVDATSPDAAVWGRAPVTRVALQPAFPGHPSIVGTPSITTLRVQAIRTPENLYIRLAWEDATADVAVNGTGGFLDRVAVQFPMNHKPSTTPFMGDANARVNIWHWRADGQPETLIAAGFGTLTPASVQDARGLGVRTTKGWAVVLARRLTPASEDGVQLDGTREIPIAFAVWNGSNRERDGVKAVTLEWWWLRF
jgi:dimethylsulfide dehydrogenase subunit gamma/complex iron-sulfur molybdoenzyme family reductase subunit gamma